MFRTSGAVLSAALFVSALASLPAQAALQLQINDGLTTTTYQDNGVGDVVPTLGNITVSDGANGSITVTGVGSPLSASGTLAINDLQINSPGPGTYTISLTNTDQTSPTGPLALFQQLTVASLTGGGNVTLSGYEDNTNTAFGTTGLSTTIGPVSALGLATSSSAVGNFTASYSLTEIATVVFASAGTFDVQFTGNLSPTPEPASIVLFGSLLAGMGLFMRKRFQALN